MINFLNHNLVRIDLRSKMAKDKAGIKAMVLAAGEGTRLRPVTNRIPKPLVPVGERPLLANILLNLQQAGVTDFAVNTHHLGLLVEDYIRQSLFADKVTLYPEEEILGTGGPLVNARKQLLDGDAFILHNGDILTDLDLASVVESHRQSENLATMVLLDGPENRVRVNSEGRIIDILDKLGFSAENTRMLTYTGIAVLSPQIFDYLPLKPEFSSIITGMLKAMADGRIVGAFISEDVYWNDLGMVDKLLQANSDIVQGKIALPKLRKREGFYLDLLGEEGSLRDFYRIQVGKEKQVLMLSGGDAADFDWYIKVGAFLHELDLATPEIFGVDEEAKNVLLEDLGDESLFKLATGIKRHKAEIEKYYRQVIDFLVQMQVKTDQALRDRPTDFIRPFNYEYLRWETNYFRENFLEIFLGLGPGETGRLDTEFHALAEVVLKQPKAFIHRDFQSRNIHFKDGAVRIIDFQGSRIGHFAYDLMSLLKDGYVELPGELRDNLQEYFREQLAIIGGPDYSPQEFAEFAVTAALQRNMQALGAFTFLSLVKGKKQYLDFIPLGIKHLQATLTEHQQLGIMEYDLPALREMMNRV